jgi:plasmid stabilization system protein ParE
VKVRIALTEPAQEERLEAVRFYRAASVEAARSFARAFKHELALLKERPELGTPYLEGTRRKVFPYFPYSLMSLSNKPLRVKRKTGEQSRLSAAIHLSESCR